MQVTPVSSLPVPATDSALKRVAQELEAGFIAEMLKQAKLGETPNTFGGGNGEDQFASFLRLEQARKMAATGGFGLAEAIFQSIKDRENDNNSNT